MNNYGKEDRKDEPPQQPSRSKRALLYLKHNDKYYYISSSMLRSYDNDFANKLLYFIKKYKSTVLQSEEQEVEA